MLEKIFGTYSQRTIKQYDEVVAKINSLEKTLIDLTPEDLKQKTTDFKKRLSQGATLDDLLPEAFAVVREVAKRTLGQRHFDVQLIGGIVLHYGNIAEMKTGEGKTLAGTLPAYLNALSGDGVHIVTVNDYLSRRDATWMGQIYDALGLTVGVISHEASFLYDSGHKEVDAQRDREGSFNVFYEFLKPVSRREAYMADITYGTNNEFGFDYLRDNLAYSKTNVCQRLTDSGKYNFAIIDEVDSILIDESRTPLIISAPVARSADLYKTFAQIATKLSVGVDYSVDEKLKAVSLTDEGISHAEELLGINDIYTEKGVKYVHHLETALRAKALFIKDKHYVVNQSAEGGEVVIVDEFTGRLQPGRRWSEGLHQAVEAKEGVKIADESRTFATVTYQNYFRLYAKLAGMTGTGLTSREEFMKVYGLDTLAIPTNRPSGRVDLPDLIFQTEHGKFLAISRAVKKLYEAGQPVLIGTVSIENNETLSQYLKKAGVPHEVLNAKNHEKEGSVIAASGQQGAVVVATNMAGRGVDIKLGGAVPTPIEYEEIKKLGGLFVLGTERHEARRIDDQLRGRAGRQGDPGTTQFFLSLEDSLMRIFAPERIRSMMGRFGIAEDEPIENRFITKAIANAQAKIEGMNFDARKHLLEYDDVINHQRVTMYGRRREILVGDSSAIDKFLDKALTALSYSAEDRDKFWTVVNEKKELDPDKYIQNVRQVIMQVIDMFWVEHLEAIDYLKSSVRLRAYGQRDPLVEFKKEGLNLFKNLELSIFEQAIKIISNIGNEEIKTTQEEGLKEIHQSVRLIGNQSSDNNMKNISAGQFAQVGRNEPCPCGATNPDGSPVKYKKCHGK